MLFYFTPSILCIVAQHRCWKIKQSLSLTSQLEEDTFLAFYHFKCKAPISKIAEHCTVEDFKKTEGCSYGLNAFDSKTSWYEEYLYPTDCPQFPGRRDLMLLIYDYRCMLSICKNLKALCYSLYIVRLIAKQEKTRDSALAISTLFSTDSCICWIHKMTCPVALCLVSMVSTLWDPIDCS